MNHQVLEHVARFTSLRATRALLGFSYERSMQLRMPPCRGFHPLVNRTFLNYLNKLCAGRHCSGWGSLLHDVHSSTSFHIMYDNARCEVKLTVHKDVILRRTDEPWPLSPTMLWEWVVAPGSERRFYDYSFYRDDHADGSWSNVSIGGAHRGMDKDVIVIYYGMKMPIEVYVALHLSSSSVSSNHPAKKACVAGTR